MVCLMIRQDIIYSSVSSAITAYIYKTVATIKDLNFTVLYLRIIIVIMEML